MINQGQFQLELGLQEEHRKTGVTKTTTAFFPTLIRFGVTNRFEARIESNSITTMRVKSGGSPATQSTGYSPVSLGFKYAIYDSQGDSRRSLGALVRAFPPSGSSEFRGDRLSGDVRLAADWDFARQFSLNPNVGVARQQDSKGRTFVSALGALTLTYLPTESLNPFIDAGFQSPEESRGSSEITVDCGVAYLMGRNIQFDFSAGKGIRGRTPPRPFLAVGFSFRT